MFSFLHSLLKFYSKQKFVLVLVFGSIYQHFTFFANSYLFYKMVLLLKTTLFNTVHCDGKNLTRLWWRCYDLRVEKVGAHAAFWENLWAKADPNRASIDSSEKRIMLDYQLTVLLVKWLGIFRESRKYDLESRSYLRLSLKIPSQYETYTW